MDSEEAEFRSDFFLRDVPNVKISQERKKEAPKNRAKEEIKVLQLSENSQQMVMDTLQFIHGEDYTLSDASVYEDKALKFNNKFLHQSNLVVKGGFYHTDTSETTEADKFRIFALLRLESYGFHKNHCVEALDLCNGNLEEALCFLYVHYIGKLNESSQTGDLSTDELLEQRNDEKSVLESIYESAFEEKIVNSVWLFKLKLEYLVNLYHPQRINKVHVQSTKSVKKSICRGFIRGNCKFGNKCRFSHQTEDKDSVANSHLNNYNFTLEVRFPENTKYPYDPPMFYLKTDFTLPDLTNMRICRKLHEEAKNSAHDGMPSIYSIVELLKNEEEIKNYLDGPSVKFPSPLEKLLKETIVRDPTIVIDKYRQKGVTHKDNKQQTTLKEVSSQDKVLINKLAKKSSCNGCHKLFTVRRNLPAYSLRHDIINTVKSYQVTVISGETGCGKSTQVPQYFLEDWITSFDNDNKHVEIVCTQPRRISAIGVAERVAEERSERVGDIVGYQIRLESKISNSTRLTFCTTGILLRRLELDPFLSKVTHVIVDEVHERSEESDFLLLILKNLIQIRSDLKIILMSATLNSQLFSDYFGSVPTIEIPGRTFPVEQFYLEDILEEIDFVMEENTQFTRKIKSSAKANLETELEMSSVLRDSMRPNDSIKDEKLTLTQVLARYKDYSSKTCKNLYLMDPEKINLELIEAIIIWLVSGDHNYPNKGSILVFLPGIAEITSLYERLKNNSIFRRNENGKYKIFPLHSSISSEDQALVFKTFKDTRKIILSTNLAETSITIDDCVYVIDSGKMKEKHFDSNRNMESLEMVWITQANAAQRKGRAGRVMPGYCFHLFTSCRYKNHMLKMPIPEIHRVPLEQLLLHIKILTNFDHLTVYQVLDSILEPPAKENIDSAIIRLRDVGAFDEDNALTPLGRHLAALPVDVRIGKLMLYSAIFSCVDAALTIAASLSHKSPFVLPFDKKHEAMAKKKEFAIGYSDHLTLLQVYKKWQKCSEKSYMAGRNFADENYLSMKTLETLADIKYQFLELLVSIGFVSIDLVSHRHHTGRDRICTLTGSEYNKNADNVRLLTAILCAALYPNIVKVLAPQTIFLRSAAGAVPVEREAKELKFKTQKEEVFLHPNSINFSVTNFPSPYLVFQEKVKTSKIFVRDCSMVPIIPLVLFSGSDVKISVNGGVTFIILANGWIQFHVEDHQIAEMIKAIRVELLDLLEEKIQTPLLNLLHNEKGERIINTIVHIATND